MRRGLYGFAVCLFLVVPCSANNSYFIPGDAFFYCEIDQAEWKALESGKLSVLRYDRPETLSFTFCGYAGYENLGVANLPEAYRAELVRAIAAMKAKYPTKIVEIDHGEPKFLIGPSGIEKKEINKIRVFVYNRSFDPAKFRIGLKYNESWSEAGVALGFPKDHFRYDFFVASPQGIAESWRMGTDVAPLAVEFPKSERGYVTEPMTINPAGVKFVICPPIGMSALHRPPRDKELECFVVSGEGRETLVNAKSKPSRWIPKQ